jgi:hypothetical protein
MSRVEEMRLRSPGLAERLWYRRLGIPLPSAIGHTGPWHARWMQLLPYPWRLIHRAYAAMFGYFWMPCILCDRPYGGHEAGKSIPDPTKEPGRGITICSRCTRGRSPAP